MTTTLDFEPTERNFACPSCGESKVSASPFHNCARWDGLALSMVEVRALGERPDGTHKAVMREDYAGNANPVAAVRTERPDGSNDITVLAPTAVLRLSGFNVDHSVAASAGLAAAQSSAMRWHHKGHGDEQIARMRRIAEGVKAEMAWSASGVFAYAVLQLASKAGQNLSSDSYKVALYGNSGTPDKTVTTAVATTYAGSGSQWVTGNEVSGTGYTAGGVAVSSPTLTQSSNVVTFTSAGTPQWTTASFTAYGDLVYDTTSSNVGLCFNYFGGQQTVTAGTFTITWNASGIAAFTC